jgi:hypothetical protein
MLAEHPEPVVTAVRAIANAAPGCVVSHSELAALHTRLTT